MCSEKPQLHVVFGASAAGTLRQALKVTKRAGLVIAPLDDFSFGPIETDDAEVRARWVESELGYSAWEEFSDESVPVLKASQEATEPLIAWVSPDSAHSVAGFLWWLSFMADKPCLVLDVPLLSLLGPDALGELLDKAEPLSDARRANELVLWKQLKRENAPLRILSEGKLISAPMDYFDSALFGHITEKWQKMAMIVGRTLVEFSQSGVFQTGDLVLAARLVRLAETGILEWQGDLHNMQSCELRRPT